MSKQSNGIIYDRYRKMIQDGKDPLMKGTYYNGRIYLCFDHMGFCMKPDSLPEDIFIAPNGIDNSKVYNLMKNSYNGVGNDRIKLPSITELKAFIKEHNLKRRQSLSNMDKPWIRACRYKLNDYNYVNVFYLLDAITLIPDGVCYGYNKWIYSQWTNREGNKIRLYHPIKIENSEGEWAIIMPIRPPETD